ncbi:hypothetical protein [Corallococcus terminator]|uniref:SH3 domain-containing protein n=1 Tax=Corallococcus terminator TaxID=2316733 RepID=A0A3A8IYP3_9BACT|nr:hypothetical protein [Corallococcus terminator]RKG83451.1 hypothetical protein D7V88_24135 [Corallococcus terminator]
MKNLRTLLFLVGSTALWTVGCGGAPEEGPLDPEVQSQVEPQPQADEGRTVHAQAGYSVCWPTLGVYGSPSTSGLTAGSLVHGRDTFYPSTQVFWSNGEYWVYGEGFGYANGYDYYSRGYVRWAGLCH